MDPRSSAVVDASQELLRQGGRWSWRQWRQWRLRVAVATTPVRGFLLRQQRGAGGPGGGSGGGGGGGGGGSGGGGGGGIVSKMMESLGDSGISGLMSGLNSSTATGFGAIAEGITTF